MSASRIAPKLYQGSLPPFGTELAEKGFQTLVLCAEEWQPGAGLFPGVEVLYCPFADRAAPLSRGVWERIHHTAARVARRVQRQDRVLVTCAAGLNRSGLVTALALIELYGCSGEEAIVWVRRERSPAALSNRTFATHLARIPARHAPETARHPSSPLIVVP
jgi:protein-tyrosine phosphatase